MDIAIITEQGKLIIKQITLKRIKTLGCEDVEDYVFSFYGSNCVFSVIKSIKAEINIEL